MRDQALKLVDKRLRLTYSCTEEEETVAAHTATLSATTELDPREAAARLVAVHRGDREWLNDFAEHLDRHRAAQSLARIMTVWHLNQSQAAALFGVSRQALHKWLGKGVPADRAEQVADLARATDLLVHYLERERIPAVVRRSMPARDGRSLMDLFASGETRALFGACRDMFDFDRAQS